MAKGGSDRILELPRSSWEYPGIVAVPLPNWQGLAAHAQPTQPACGFHLASNDQANQYLAIPTDYPTPVPVSTPRRKYQRWEPYAVMPHVRICAGGLGKPGSLPQHTKGPKLLSHPMLSYHFSGFSGKSHSTTRFSTRSISSCRRNGITTSVRRGA